MMSRSIKKKQEVRLNAQNYRPSITAMKKKKVSKQKKKKLRVYISSQEWNEIEKIGSGVNFYKGQKTFFYNGQPLIDDTGQLVYDDIERSTCQVIIILTGLIEIPSSAFCRCWHVKIVIMADTVKRIHDKAFMECSKLSIMRLSTSLECIGNYAFKS